MNIIALILARSGSKGLKNKNIKRLRGYNLIQWSVFSALESSFVKKIIISQLNVSEEQVTPEASFIDDLGADSLDQVELVMALEEEFGTEIPEDEAEKLQTVGSVISYVESNLS